MHIHFSIFNTDKLRFNYNCRMLKDNNSKDFNLLSRLDLFNKFGNLHVLIIIALLLANQKGSLLIILYQSNFSLNLWYCYKRKTSYRFSQIWYWTDHYSEKVFRFSNQGRSSFEIANFCKKILNQDCSQNHFVNIFWLQLSM